MRRRLAEALARACYRYAKLNEKRMAEIIDVRIVGRSGDLALANVRVRMTWRWWVLRFGIGLTKMLAR
jgi:hypothetical protein